MEPWDRVDVLNHHLPSQEFDVWKRIGGNMEKYVTNM